MAVRITQIGPDTNAPEVPRTPRLESNADLAGGLLDFARGVGQYMEAREAYDEKLRAERERMSGEAGNDYVAKARDFVARARQVRATVKDGLKLSGDVASRFDRDADELDQVHGDGLQSDVFTRSIPAARERLRGQVKRTAEDVVRAPSRKNRDLLRRNARAMVDEHVRAGIVGVDEADALEGDLERDIEDASVQERAKTDPDGALAMLTDGSLTYLPASRREELADMITVDLNKRRASQKADFDHAIDTLQGSLKSGTLPPDAVLASLNDLMLSHDDPALKDAVTGVQKASATVKRMGRVPLAQAREDFSVALAKAKGPERDALQSFGGGWIRDMEKSLAGDPMRFAGEQGVLELEPLDWNAAGPDAFAARAKQARMVANFYGLPQVNYLTGDERAALSDAFAKAEPERKADILQLVSQSFGKDDGPRLFREIEGLAPADTHLATLSVHGGGREDVARRGFVGQQLLKDKAVTMPPDSEFAGVENETIGALFDARMAQSRGKVIAAARALYAERAVSKGLQGFDRDVYRDAVEVSLGKGKSGGGPATRNGRKLVLPMDMTAADLDQHIDGLQEADLKALSPNGRAPVHVSLSGKVVPATVDDIRKGVLVQAGYGRYRVSMTDPASGMAQYLAEEGTGQYYEIDLSDPARRPARLVETVEVNPETGDIGLGSTRVKPDAPVKMQDRLPVEDVPVIKKMQDSL